jgi:UDP-N-acetylmuramate--alanine ligase
MVYQPHRYTRTFDLFDQFADVLSGVDHLILTEVYSAGEDLIPGATGKDLYQSLRGDGQVEIDFITLVADVPARLNEIVRADDVVLTQGAGETARLAQVLKSEWVERRVE